MSTNSDRDCPDGSSGSSSRSVNRRPERSAIREEIFHTEPATIPRPNRGIQTQAIRAYHDHALSARTSEHREEARRARENRRRAEQQLTHGAFGSDVSTSASESDESSSSRRKPSRASEHSNPKYLVRGFLKTLFRSRSSQAKDDSRKQCSDHEAFFPSPKITFLIDQPDNLVCQICQETPLKMGIAAAEAKETTPALLPCGHLACSPCLELWLRENGNCPFCRQDMTYKGCGHGVEPRLVAHDTIHSIPRTLADGGKIGHSCSSCRGKAQRAASLKKWLRLADEFKTARREAEERKTEESEQAVKKARKAFERVPFDEAYDTLALTISTW